MLRALVCALVLAAPAQAQDRPDGGALLDSKAFQAFVDATIPFVDRFLADRTTPATPRQPRAHPVPAQRSTPFLPHQPRT